MPKILSPAYPIGEVVNCICGTTWEVEVGDGYTIGDSRVQVQPDGSKIDVITDIAWLIPCPHCRHEAQFEKRIDDCSGPEWDLTRQAASAKPEPSSDPTEPEPHTNSTDALTDSVGSEPPVPSVTEKPEEVDEQVAAVTKAASDQPQPSAETE